MVRGKIFLIKGCIFFLEIRNYVRLPVEFNFGDQNVKNPFSRRPKGSPSFFEKDGLDPSRLGNT
jgi:hypothetical protein